jgi:hypothetical protein
MKISPIIALISFSWPESGLPVQREVLIQAEYTSNFRFVSICRTALLSGPLRLASLEKTKGERDGEVFTVA